MQCVVIAFLKNVLKKNR